MAMNAGIWSSDVAEASVDTEADESLSMTGCGAHLMVWVGGFAKSEFACVH